MNRLNLNDFDSLVRAAALLVPSGMQGVSLAGCACEPFGGSKRDGATKRPGVSVGNYGSGAMAAMFAMLERMGVPTCRMWGEAPPVDFDQDTGCFRGKKICLVPLPYTATVTAGATAFEFELLAKKWFWPILWADNSESQVSIVDIEYTGDPVLENGQGSGAFVPSALFGPTGNYGIAFGFPAFGNSSGNGLLFTLANSDGGATHLFRGVFIGVSIRN